MNDIVLDGSCLSCLARANLQPVAVPRRISLGASETTDTSGRLVFGVMLVGFGAAIGFALGMSQGVRVSRGAQ